MREGEKGMEGIEGIVSPPGDLQFNQYCAQPNPIIEINAHTTLVMNQIGQKYRKQSWHYSDAISFGV